MKILLVASSRHGSTEEVASVIADELRKSGMEVDLSRPEDVTSVVGYDAFVIGSAVYLTRWTEAALDFCRRFQGALSSHPVWAFSVGLSGLPKGKVSDSRRIGPVLLALDVEGHVTFAGRFDPGKLNLRERTIAKVGGAAEGDFRDWDEVRAWAKSIVEVLRQA
ncbi:Protoporphyrinogen IX dehydrogenase [menaquinone] [Actinomyces bovis]|uniref:Protoporphyrinogen IX dehydrogenase [menaquinone] n=1 Tax=Actinomyces bovis TaxID=1658 RepID=A0ABY1VSF4_9ACTO|nr:flavodoxin domain-containing protein [Actinomyces bovis]SPT53968.1 Protoporphyrinogen IX dehydrogenase [menaquinone] [Actinomyces bovis]VEG53505.1 Protoporphyrinogen IX dehydrogenase [menaquinone] [Actinomyces israelii]